MKAFFSFLFLIFSFGIYAQDAPVNVIFFISDGMGFNHVDATSYYQHGRSGSQVYESSDWVQLAMSTYPAILRISDGDTVYSSGYNPRAASRDHTYVRRDYTDSGAAGTALSTGRKVFGGSIGIGVMGDTLLHISQAAKALGKSAGVVASVPFSHATPASFCAHNHSRQNYEAIARYMLFNTRLDVIMGTGNPDYDNNGSPSEQDAKYVGGSAVWDFLNNDKEGTVLFINDKEYRVMDASGDGTADPWTLIQDRQAFQQLPLDETPPRVLGVPRVYATLQQGRDTVPGSTAPFDTPLNKTVPTLEEMTISALHVLGQNPEGFFVMIEGGAVDWASHRNQSDRMIEEQIDFNHSVEAAVQWVEENSSFEETLIIVTSDHECGYLTGPGEPDPLYPAVINYGKGNLPGMQWNSGSHTNMLVPFYARGAGSENFNLLAGEHDPEHGSFIQNSQIAPLIFMLWGIQGH